jgi:hypothetical protein
MIRQLCIAALMMAGSASAQGIQDVMNALMLARTTSTTVLTVTATQGDGSTLKLVKSSGGSISLTGTWTSADGKNSLPVGPMHATGGTMPVTVSVGDITCMIAGNPTAATVSIGVVIGVPPNGVGWVCATNITGGSQTAPVSGTAVWP